MSGIKNRIKITGLVAMFYITAAGCHGKPAPATGIDTVSDTGKVITDTIKNDTTKTDTVKK